MYSALEKGRSRTFAETVQALTSRKKRQRKYSEEEIQINVSVGNGTGTATAWGCDLTYDYVKINGDYRS